ERRAARLPGPPARAAEERRRRLGRRHATPALLLLRELLDRGLDPALALVREPRVHPTRGVAAARRVEALDDRPAERELHLREGRGRDRPELARASHGAQLELGRGDDLVDEP